MKKLNLSLYFSLCLAHLPVITASEGLARDVRGGWWVACTWRDHHHHQQHNKRNAEPW